MAADETYDGGHCKQSDKNRTHHHRQLATDKKYLSQFWIHTRKSLSLMLARMLSLVCLLLCVHTDVVLATYINIADARLAVELEANVLIHPSPGEPPFSDSITTCLVDRVLNTGFTVVLPGEFLSDLRSASVHTTRYPV